jgi:hypothetical protein
MANQSQVSDFDANTVLDCLIDVRRAIAKLQAQDAALLARLDELAAAGEIDQGGFTHAGWSFSHSAGRRSWDYPSAVKALEAQAKAAKKAAEADGSATAIIGASFWTLKPPKKP